MYSVLNLCVRVCVEGAGRSIGSVLAIDVLGKMQRPGIVWLDGNVLGMHNCYH